MENKIKGWIAYLNEQAGLWNGDESGTLEEYATECEDLSEYLKEYLKKNYE